MVSDEIFPYISTHRELLGSSTVRKTKQRLYLPEFTVKST